MRSVTKLVKILALAFLAGCGEGNAELAPVRGVVKLDGKPLTSGSVITLPQAGRGARGLIGADGKFELMTVVEGDGARVGQHRVGVVAYEGGSKGPEAEQGKLLVPQKYTNPATSGLTIEVTEDVPNEPVLELSSK